MRIKLQKRRPCVFTIQALQRERLKCLSAVGITPAMLRAEGAPEWMVEAAQRQIRRELSSN